MKAPRDFSPKQFTAALASHGFRKTMLWIEDTSGQVTNICWGILMHRGGKIARRATLAYVIRERDAEVAKRSKVAL